MPLDPKQQANATVTDHESAIELEPDLGLHLSGDDALVRALMLTT